MVALDLQAELEAFRRLALTLILGDTLGRRIGAVAIGFVQLPLKARSLLVERRGFRVLIGRSACIRELGDALHLHVTLA